MAHCLRKWALLRGAEVASLTDRLTEGSGMLWEPEMSFRAVKEDGFVVRGDGIWLVG